MKNKDKSELTIEEGVVILNLADQMIAEGGLDGAPITVARAYRFAHSGLNLANGIARQVMAHGV